MPSHSPELQLSQSVFGLQVNEPIANRSFQNLDELEELLFQRCRVLLKQPSLIKGITCFDWGQKPKLYHSGATGNDIISIPVQPETISVRIEFGFYF
jgi:hypothetical protein